MEDEQDDHSVILHGGLQGSSDVQPLIEAEPSQAMCDWVDGLCMPIGSQAGRQWLEGALP